MSDRNAERAVLVLTEKPGLYSEDMRRLDLQPSFVPSTSALLAHLAESRICGFVLELDKVLSAPAAQQEQVFQLSEIFPLLRAKPDNSGQGKAVYLDNLERFAAEARNFSPRSLRNVPRVPVLLRGLVSPVGDPGARPVLVSILDLSFEGGFLNSETEFGPSEDLSLRILGLTDPEPVRASVRWRKTVGGVKDRHCAGVRFLYIRPGQAEELKQRYLSPEEDAD